MHRIVVFVSLCIALLVVAACGSDNSGGQSQSTSAKTPAKADPGNAVVFVRASYKSHKTAGTGFIFDARQGLILTSDHAVEAAPAITVTDRHGQVMHGQVLARAQCHDFAVVKLHPIPTDLSALTFADSSSVHDGASVTSVSYSLNNSETGTPTLTTTRGTVSAVNVAAKLHHLLPTISPLIAHQVPLNAQGSGSPLLDATGKVVGLNTLVGFDHEGDAVQGLNYALESSFVYEQLRALKSGTDRDLTGWRSEHRCHKAMDTIAGVPYQHTEMEGHGGSMDSGQSGHGGGSMGKDKKDSGSSEHM
jgi:S1-C subfamily serine protease